MKKALITGVTGQDGSYLSEFLIEKGYDVHGIIRRSSVDYRERIAHLEGNPHFHLHYGDMGDSMSLVAVCRFAKSGEMLLIIRRTYNESVSYCRRLKLRPSHAASVWWIKRLFIV